MGSCYVNIPGLYGVVLLGAMCLSHILLLVSGL